MLPPRRLALVLLAACGACAHVDPEREVLDSVRFEGNRSFADDELLDHLALVPTSPWPWADPQYFDRGTLAGDRRRLLRFYRASGFYEAKVRSQVTTDGRSVRVRIAVEEGPPTLVRKVDVEGVAGLPEDLRRELRLSDLPLEPGRRITEDAYDAALAELRTRLRERGHGDAAATGEVRVDVAAHAADVKLVVVPGPRLRFGRVIVVGAVEVPRAAIEEQASSEIESGSEYRESALARARSAVYEMNVFGAVAVRRGPTDPETGTVPVVIEVSEAPLHTLRAGGGASFEPRRQEVRAIGEYEDRDFLGNLRVLRFQNRLGYAFLCPTGSGLFDSATGLLCFQDPGDQGVVGASSLDLTQPALFGPRVSGVVGIQYERQRDLSYEVGDFVRGRVGLPVRIARNLQLVPSYNVERSFYRSQPEQQEGLICNAPTGGAGCAVTLSRLEESLVWDGRDDPILTTRGAYAALTLGQSGGPLGGNFDYDGVLADVRTYHPLGRRLVLAFRLLGGLLVPRSGDTPITQRFFAGGGSSLRSYGLQAFSPSAFVDDACGDGSGSAADLVARAACLSGDPVTTVPVGGNQMVAGSAELRARVWGDFGLVGFADVASVQARAFDPLRPSLALGGGLRYATPFGPVRLDVGVNVLGDPPVVTGVVNGRNVSVPIDEPSFALHFSVGEAF